MFEFFGFVLMVVAWLVPDHYLPWLSAYNDSAMALALMFFVVAILREGAVIKTVPIIFWVVVAIAIIPWLQWAVGQLAFSGDAVIGSVYVLGFAAAVLTGFVWAKENAPDSARLLAGVILVGALLSSVIAIHQGLRAGDFGLLVAGVCVDGRACGNLAQPNNLATLLGLGSISLFLLYEQGRVGRLLSSVLLGLLILGAASSQSRTALLFGPAVFLGLLISQRRGIFLRVNLLTVGVAVAVHWLLTWSWPKVQAELLLNTAAPLGARSLDAGRVQGWAMFADALSQSPWTGVGWLQTASAQLAVADRYPPMHVVWQHAHNIFFELMLWCGYPIGIFLSGSIIFWFVSRFFSIRNTEGVAAMLSVSLFGIHSMLELPYHYAYFIVPIGLWVGHVEFSTGGAVVRKFGRLSCVPVLIAATMVIGVWKDYPDIEEDARRIRFENLRVGPFYQDEYAPEAPFLSAQVEFLKFMRTRPSSDMPIDKMRVMEAVTNRFPYAGVMAKMSMVMALNGRLPDAVKMFNSIKYIHGEGVYKKLRKDLHERIVVGRRDLLELDGALPDR